MAASAQGLPDGTPPNVAGHVSGLGPGGHPVGEPGGSAEIQTPPLHAETVSQEASDLPPYSQTSPSSLHAEPRTGAVVGHTALHASRAASWPRWVDASDPASDASLARFAGIPESSDASPSSGSNSPDAAPQPTRDATLAHTTAVRGRAFTAVEHTARAVTLHHHAACVTVPEPLVHPSERRENGCPLHEEHVKPSDETNDLMDIQVPSFGDPILSSSSATLAKDVDDLPRKDSISSRRTPTDSNNVDDPSRGGPILLLLVSTELGIVRVLLRGDPIVSHAKATRLHKVHDPSRGDPILSRIVKASTNNVHDLSHGDPILTGVMAPDMNNVHVLSCGAPIVSSSVLSEENNVDDPSRGDPIFSSSRAADLNNVHDLSRGDPILSSSPATDVNNVVDPSQWVAIVLRSIGTEIKKDDYPS